jgi:hypothetical protein
MVLHAQGETIFCFILSWKSRECSPRAACLCLNAIAAGLTPLQSHCVCEDGDDSDSDSDEKVEMKITDDGSYLRAPTDWILSTCLSIVHGCAVTKLSSARMVTMHHCFCCAPRLQVDSQALDVVSVVSRACRKAD